MNRKLYIFDTSALITSQKTFYCESFAQCFWDWLRNGIKASQFISPMHVRREIEKGDAQDFLVKIAKNDDFHDFWENESANTENVLKSYQKLQNWAANDWRFSRTDSSSQKVKAALIQFAKEENADPWVIALGMVKKAQGFDVTIVSQEETALESQKNIKIPDAAAAHGLLKTIPIWECLRETSGDNFKFTFK